MSKVKHSAAIALSAGLMVSLAYAASRQSSVDTFNWTQDSQSLALRSQSGGASAGEVVVTRADPAPFHGLRAGDVILAVDGVPLHQVEGLMRALRARTSDVALRVRRGNAETTLVWSPADYRGFVSPPSPVPPAPPAPPSPPHG
jgi:S1-C subfamily serine protease